jgi:hypothetical protein
MSDDPLDAETTEPAPAFDSHSPRWQENEAAPGEVERYRRSRMDAQPEQRGALDVDGSVPRSAPSAIPPGDESAP